MASGFFMIDNSVLDLLPTIKPTGFAVYSYLVKCADSEGHCFPTQSQIAGKLGLTDRHVRTMLKTLESVGLISQCHDPGKRSTFTVVLGGTPRKNASASPGSQLPHTPEADCRTPRKLTAAHPGNPVQRNKDEQDPENKTHPEGERASAPPPPNPYLAAERNYHESFADALFDFHGGTPQGKLQAEYIDRLADWEKRGIRPSQEQFRLAVSEACAYWRRERKHGRCTVSGPVLKALTDLVNPALLVDTKTQTVTANPLDSLPTAEERRAQLRAIHNGRRAVTA